MCLHRIKNRGNEAHVYKRFAMKTKANPLPRNQAKARLPLESRLAYSLQEVGSLLGIHYTTLWRMVEEGRLSLIANTRRKMISRRELERFLNETEGK
jgi:excisionase family DNA binding protein